MARRNNSRSGVRSGGVINARERFRIAPEHSARVTVRVSRPNGGKHTVTVCCGSYETCRAFIARQGKAGESAHIELL